MLLFIYSKSFNIWCVLNKVCSTGFVIFLNVLTCTKLHIYLYFPCVSNDGAILLFDVHIYAYQKLSKSDLSSYIILRHIIMAVGYVCF